MLLTRNEQANISSCLASLAGQTNQDFEVIVLDAASTDGTVAAIRRFQPDFPVPLHLETSDRVVPIGEARNLGVRLARAELVAFVSADAELDEAWIERALDALQENDLVFGRQVHEPHSWTLGASVRGLRYHFPARATKEPLRYASNVAAAYHKDVLRTFPFDPWANAAEDLLLARRAAAAGFRVHYDPELVARHHDVATARAEMRKMVREGEGCGLYVAELGPYYELLIWGTLLILGVAILALEPGWGTALLLLLVLWLPTLRRVGRRLRSMPKGPLMAGAVASPAFDLVFLFNYARGLVERALHPPPRPFGGSHA